VGRGLFVCQSRGRLDRHDPGRRVDRASDGVGGDNLGCSAKSSAILWWLGRLTLLSGGSTAQARLMGS
jgi:hypothetical protein